MSMGDANASGRTGLKASVGDPGKEFSGTAFKGGEEGSAADQLGG